MLLMIDNYDSFTYNIVQYLGELGQDVRVFRNDESRWQILKHYNHNISLFRLALARQLRRVFPWRPFNILLAKCRYWAFVWGIKV